MHSSHYHTCYPEKNNIRGSNQDISRIIIILLLFSSETSYARASLRTRYQEHLHPVPVFNIGRRINITVNIIGSFIIPNRNSMTPPKLARYAPILNVIHPMIICFNPMFRVEFNLSIINNIKSGLASSSIFINHCTER